MSEPVKRIHSSPRERSARVLRLKEELNLILELVVHSREALGNELNSEFAQLQKSVDKSFLRKLKDLTSCYNSLSSSRIQLDKAERQMEKEMTAEEEKEAVISYLMSLEARERSKMLNEVIELHAEARPASGVGRPSGLKAKLLEHLTKDEYEEITDLDAGF